jgi:protein TonB
MTGLLLLVVACVTREPLGTASGGQTVHQVPEVVVVGARSDSARSTSPGPILAPANRPFFEFQVEQKAMPIAGGVAVRYPDSLRVAGIEGEVLAQFVVNADGIPDVQSLKILRATRNEFVDAVRNALPGLRFSAARVGDRAVRQLVQQPFVFSVPK